MEVSGQLKAPIILFPLPGKRPRYRRISGPQRMIIRKKGRNERRKKEKGGNKKEQEEVRR
jgi:hypothetical protein